MSDENKIVENEKEENKVVETKVEEKKEAKKSEKEINLAQLDSVKSEDLKVVVSLLQDLKKDQELERKHARNQMILATITSILSLGIVLVCVLILLPSILTTMGKVNTVLDETLGMVGQIQEIVENLDGVSNELNSMNLTAMVENVNKLVTEGQASMGEAMGKISAIDIDGLNKAIKDLGSVVAPLAKLFGGRR